MNDDAKSPQQLAEENAHLVRSSDQLAREAAGIPEPEEGHDVGEWLRENRPELYQQMQEAQGPDVQQQLADMQRQIDELKGQA